MGSADEPAVPPLPPLGKMATHKTISIGVDLTFGNRRLRAKVPMPAGPVRRSDMLPLLQDLADAVVAEAVANVHKQGQSISCKQGCAACCRQLVPIGQTEARRLRDLVDETPDPKRALIRARFAQAREHLRASGLLDRLLARQHWTPEEAHAIGIEFFRLAIPCPFLQDETCSIYPDRPIRCREYLVTSPAEHCAQPTGTSVRTVRIPLKMATAVALLDQQASAEPSSGWVPLILALEWADAHPDEAPPRPAQEVVKELFSGNSMPLSPIERPPTSAL